MEQYLATMAVLKIYMSLENIVIITLISWVVTERLGIGIEVIRQHCSEADPHFETYITLSVASQCGCTYNQIFFFLISFYCTTTLITDYKYTYVTY